MDRRVGQYRLHLGYRQTEIGGDVDLIDTGFPILNDVIRGHASTFQHGAAMLHVAFYFDEGAIGPIHK
jgi:hypothetical protein